MRIIRYRDPEGVVRFGGAGPADGDAWRVLDGHPYGEHALTSERCRVAKLLAPIEPTQLLCIGLNYRRHAAETGAKLNPDPVLFMKGVNAVQHPGDPIELPRFLASTQVDYECELAVVIGRTCKNATRETALQFVAGYTCANDVSARDWQLDRGGKQWCRGKTFDTFAPLGPCLVTPASMPDPDDLAIRTLLNGETVQDSRTSDMVHDVRSLIAFLSGSTTLPPGTVILTGTPEGVGLARTPPLWLKDGDEVVVEIEGIGRLVNPVVPEPLM
ncbi:MAG: fumarylacetoacetate hydrolase family protein [Planctomycetes bacterium]|nr:fumarylacetoacetate hydrolase family protein [Planctomycetota bacterium]